MCGITAELFLALNTSELKRTFFFSREVEVGVISDVGSVLILLWAKLN